MQWRHATHINSWLYNYKSDNQYEILQSVACVYEEVWWIGIILEIDKEQEDVQVNFLHPHGPSQSFHWSHVDDICWVPITHILCTVEIPITATGSWHNLRHQDSEKVKELMLAFHLYFFIVIMTFVVVFYGTYLLKPWQKLNHLPFFTSKRSFTNDEHSSLNAVLWSDQWADY